MIIDVDGYYSPDTAAVAPAEGPFQYTPIAECRNFDSRNTASPLQPGERRPIRIGGTCGIPNGAPVGAIYATVISPSVAGYSTLYPASYANPPGTSSINFAPPRLATGNGAIVRLDSFPEDMKASTAFASADMTVDSYGYFDYGAAADFVPMSGCRALDTRTSSGGGPILTGTTRLLDIRVACPNLPSNLTAVVANITVVGPTSDGFFRAYPNNTPIPVVSALNFSAGDNSVANELIFPLRDAMGQVQSLTLKPTLWTGGQTDLIVDVFGYFVGPLVGANQSTPITGLSSSEYRSIDRGFFPDQVYHIGDLDNVNLFNGNLNLNLPIGTRYPVGGGLSYGLTLSYNSNIRDLKTHLDPNSSLHDEFITEAVPSETSNAGVGWTLGMGSFRLPRDQDPARYEYISPDGAAHRFSSVLNAYNGSSPANPTPGVFYTRDGSYLRLTLTGNQGPGALPTDPVQGGLLLARKLQQQRGPHRDDDHFVQPGRAGDTHGLQQRNLFRDTAEREHVQHVPDERPVAAQSLQRSSDLAGLVAISPRVLLLRAGHRLPQRQTHDQEPGAQLTQSRSERRIRHLRRLQAGWQQSGWQRSVRAILRSGRRRCQHCERLRSAHRSAGVPHRSHLSGRYSGFDAVLQRF